MSEETTSAVRLTLTGRVQGLGVRPAIARAARRLSLTGWVCNTNQGIEVVAEGAADRVAQFARELTGNLPSAAVVEQREDRAIPPPHGTAFEIRTNPAAGPLQARVPLDLVVCTACRQEVMEDPAPGAPQAPRHRRLGYAFASCSDCGPRFSILESIPYERESTTMRAFGMCSCCAQEYRDPTDRRFHAETNACPVCGPACWCRDRAGRIVARGREAIDTAATALRRGEIVALQGLGGYQLVVDATSDEAVERLRNRKRRRGKPLAVMVLTIADATRLAWCNAAEQRALESAANPIVILQSRQTSELGCTVSSGLDSLGVMLPTTPLHALLLAAVRRPLVVTSGNVEGEPLEFEHPAAAQRLSTIADLWLEHNRPIRRPIDDSVVRVIADRVAVLRLARGFAPLPLPIECSFPILAVGGHQKAAVALGNGAQAVLGPHVGDLDTVAERIRWESHVGDLLELYGAKPQVLAIDAHPRYASASWGTQHVEQLRAESVSRSANRKEASNSRCAQTPRWERAHHLAVVQHHHAHVVAAMIEEQWLDRTVLGVAWDGTGWGSDETIWGGEFLVATATHFERVGHCLPFSLPGGEQAIRQPWRIAVSLIEQACGIDRAMSLEFSAGQPRDIAPLLRLSRFAPRTTSAGRLFDGVAALVLGWEQSEFEGQGPMLLESLYDDSASGQYDVPITDSEPLILDWRPMIVRILQDLRNRVPAPVIATRFHRGLACGIAAASRRFPGLPVVLCGGCFQNRRLVELLVNLFAQQNQEVATPGLIPTNDGGLAAGQLACAAQRFVAAQSSAS